MFHQLFGQAILNNITTEGVIIAPENIIYGYRAYTKKSKVKHPKRQHNIKNLYKKKVHRTQNKDRQHYQRH